MNHTTIELLILISLNLQECVVQVLRPPLSRGNEMYESDRRDGLEELQGGKRSSCTLLPDLKGGG